MANEYEQIKIRADKLSKGRSVPYSCFEKDIPLLLKALELACEHQGCDMMQCNHDEPQYWLDQAEKELK